jgi:multicomponent Na+:H+ antiporter subunit D
MLLNRTAFLLLFIATAVFFIRVHRRYNARKALLIFQAVISFYVAAFSCYLTFSLYTNSPSFLFIQDKVLGMNFNLEPIGIIFLNMVSVLWFLTSLYSIGYVDLNKKINANRFVFFMMGAVSSAIMLAIAGDLITSFIFYELLTLLTFPLIIATGAPKEVQAARKYLVTLMGLSMVLFLPAIVIVHSAAGGVVFTAGGILNSGNITVALATTAFLLLVYGVAKTAIMPVQFWLPAAMIAPVPVSALLHAVAVVKSGLLILLKLCVYVYGIDYLAELFQSNFIVILCGASVLLSAVIASYQDNIKKLLAYSTINHLSICLLSCFMFSVAGIKAAILHMIGHAISKLSLFFTTGILESKYGGTKTSDLDGLTLKSKSLAFLFAIAIFSMIGIPPLAGFIGKAYMLYAASSKAGYLAIVIVSISIVVSANYFIRLFYRLYFMAPSSSSLRVKQYTYSEGFMRIATLLGCVGILCYAAFFPFLMKFMNKIPFQNLATIWNESH